MGSLACVAYDLCGCPLNQCLDDLCGRHLTLCTLGRVDRLIDYEKQEGYFLHRFSSLVPSGLGGFLPIELLFFSKVISLIDVALPMIRPIVKSTEPFKWKQGGPTECAKKHAK